MFSLLIPLAALSVAADPAAAQDVLRQWAVWAAADSQPPAHGAADQATGQPNASAISDDNRAWTPAEADGPQAWLELVYQQAVRPTKVHIWETCEPGFVVSVEALDYGAMAPTGGPLPAGHGFRWVTLWKGEDPLVYPGPFIPPLTAAEFHTNRLRITIDAGVPGLNEIDAVELHGTDPTPVPELMPGAGAAAAEAGQPVEIQWGGQWWPGTVLKTEGGKAYVHFEGYGPEWDFWATPDRVRPRAGAPAGPAGDAAPADPGAGGQALPEPPAEPQPPAAQDPRPPAGEEPQPPAATGPPPAPGGLFDGVYYIQMILVKARTATYAVFVFLPGGRVYRGADRGGPEGFDFDAALAEAPDKCGTYTVAGDEIHIKYADGREQTSKLFATTGTYGYPTPKYPAGFTLNGRWRADALARTVAAGGIQDIYHFSPDGAFALEADGAIVRRGAYTITGNTLELQGVFPETARRAIWTFQDSATSHEPHFLNIGAIMFTRLDG
ncbi:MAG: hypothetical protein FJX74_21650 [Armatimonadetes bacterium]|nr:hypothetical protein [Armatimonadota bacterium]